MMIDDNSLVFHNLKSNVYGLSYHDWIVRWWQWVLQIPKQINPAFDDSGEHSIQNQSGPVWFLATAPLIAGGSIREIEYRTNKETHLLICDGNVERTCSVPNDKSILLPLFSSAVISDPYFHLSSSGPLSTLDRIVGTVDLTLGGLDIAQLDLQKYRVKSRLFQAALPSENILGISGRSVDVISDGYWLLLKPLQKGTHQINFSGLQPDGKGQRVIYNLGILEGVAAAFQRVENKSVKNVTEDLISIVIQETNKTIAHLAAKSNIALKPSDMDQIKGNLRKIIHNNNIEVERKTQDKQIDVRRVRLCLEELLLQGMMIMKLPMAGELNSTFNSLESHLLTADENINGYNIRGAISELNLANDQLYAHQLAMLDVVYPFFNNTRTHLKQSIHDLNSGNTQGVISELKIVDKLLRGHEQGMLMMVGRPT
jgi:hypothetical protein